MGKKKNKGKRKRAGRSKRPLKPLLSLCVIAKDEAAFLQRCLASVAGLVDEIVVVDTGSCDDTPQVARGAGARVFSQPWQDDFSQARNRSLAAARGEWILVLDCDEVLARADHDRLRDLLADPGADAYRMTTRNYCAEQNRSGWVACRGEAEEERDHPGYFPTTKVRLWRNRPALRFTGAVHELVEPAVIQAGMVAGDCLVPIHHYGHVEKARPDDLYLEAGERKVRENPDDLRAHYELAVAYRNAGRLDTALASIDQALAGASAAGVQDRIYLQRDLALLVRADILARMGRADEALAAYDDIIAEFPNAFEALNNKGLLLERAGRLDEALACFDRGAVLAPNNQVLADNRRRLQRSGQRLSVCIIARDEEAVLGRCLESVDGIADEIVVVDTGSSDGTVALAERYGATIGHFPWRDDFAAARNASLELATGDWVLWLDADDYLLPEDGEKVRRAKALSTDQAFYCTLVNEGGEKTRFRQLKMFPNRPDIRFELPVHENVAAALKRAGLPICGTDIEVRHSRVADAAAVARKNHYNLELMNKWLADHPDDWETYFRVGHSLFVTGEREAAHSYFARILAAGAAIPAGASVRRLAATFAGRCLLEMERYDEALAPLETAREMVPDERLTLLSLGDVHLKLGHAAQALEFLQAAAAGKLEEHVSLDVQVIDYSLFFFTGQALHKLGRAGEARAAFSRAAEIAPERTEAAQALNMMDNSSSTGLYITKPTASPAPTAAPAPATPVATPAGAGRLTLCMIVCDEEHRLGHCLDSVQGLVDEIVVVDTGSSDGTVALAERYGATIGHFPWCDNFALARNASLELATGDFIMWLDADDILPRECHAEIRRLVDQGGHKSYFFVLDDQGHEHVSCLQMRLFPNLPGVGFEMPVHEQVTPSLGRLGVEMVSTEVRVEHTGYTTAQVVKGKKDRYLKIMERWLEEHPADYMTRSHVALTYYAAGRLPEAEAAYRYIAEESTCRQDRNWVIYTTALLFLGRTLMKMDRFGEALDAMRRAEEVDPQYLLTRLSLAEVNARLGEWEEARRYGRATLEVDGQMTFFPIEYEEVRYSAQLICGQAAQALEQWDEAEVAFRGAAEVEVDRRSDALGNLANMFKAQNRGTDALAVLDEALAIAPGNPQHLFNKGVAYLDAQDMDRAAAHFNQALEGKPDFALALLNLGYIAKSRGQFDEAETCYRRAMACDPDGVEARANLGHLCLDMERFAAAAELFAEVRRRQQGLVDIDLGLLVAHAQQGDFGAAGPLLAEIVLPFDELQRAPGDVASPDQAARTAMALGAALLRRQLTKCAELALWAAVLLDGELVDARRALAEVLFAQGQFWKVVTQLEAVLLAVPQDGAAFMRLGDCYRQLGVDEAAQMCYAQSRQASAS